MKNKFNKKARKVALNLIENDGGWSSTSELLEEACINGMLYIINQLKSKNINELKKELKSAKKAMYELDE